LGDAFGSVAIRLVTDVVIWARECGASQPIAAGVCKKGKGWTAAIRGVSGTRRRNSLALAASGHGPRTCLG
jgi:hypothetical protein